MSSSLLFTVSCVAGVTGHLALFKHGEWERHAPRIAQLALLAEIAIYLALWSFQYKARAALVEWLIYNIGFGTGLFGSIGLYRLFFHPLRAFPGPRSAKLSALCSFIWIVPDFQLHKKVWNLHQKYGDFVRIRPRELSINHVDAVRDIHGPASKCTKGPFYDMSYPSRSLQLTRDRSFHMKRRRVWEKGLSFKAISDYEPRVLEHCRELLSKLSERESKHDGVEITSWIDFFGFDIMGDLTFGKSFNTLKQGKPHFMITQIRAIGPLVSLLGCVPWLFIIFQSLPVITALRSSNLAWCGKQLDERKQMSKSRVDLFSYLLLTSKDDPRYQTISDSDLIYDSELAITAGSHTTSTTVSAVVYLLAKNPDKQAILQREIDELVNSLDDFSHKDLVGKAPFLEGCINEALRLYPAAPSGLQRVTPPEGAMIAGQMIPGDTIVSTPTYALHQDSRNFAHPDSFIPERWSTQAHLVKAKDAFSPFLVGPYSCVGKNLAMMEMRMLVACLVRSFSFRFPNDQEDVITEKFEAGYRDHLAAQVPQFDVVISRRDGV